MKGAKDGRIGTKTAGGVGGMGRASTEIPEQWAAFTMWRKEQGIEWNTYYRWEREVLKMAGNSNHLSWKTYFAQIVPPTKMRGDEDTRANSHIETGCAIIDIYPVADLEMVAALLRVLGHVE